MKKERFNNLKRLLLLGITLCFFAMAIHADAVGLVGSQNTLSREKVSEASNHTLSFQTPSGVGVAETVQIIFPGDFVSLGTITPSDVDIYKNTVLVPAVDWTMVNTGSDITFTFLASVAPGDTLDFLIGIHTVAGINQVINPALPGLYMFEIQGTFGDNALVRVPVLEDDQVHVYAKVIGPPVVTTGGGSGGGSRRCRFLNCLIDNSDNDSIVRLEGWSHPYGVVVIYNNNGDVIGTTQSTETGFFSVDIQNFSGGEHTLRLLGIDNNGLQAPLVSIDFNVTYNTVTIIDRLVLPPTISLSPDTYNSSDQHVNGYTVPFGRIELDLGKGISIVVIADKDGYWEYMFEDLTIDDAFIIKPVVENTDLRSQEGKAVLVLYTEKTLEVSKPIEEFVFPEVGALDRKSLCLLGDISFDGYVSLSDLSIASFFRDKSHFVNPSNLLNRDSYCLDNNKIINMIDFSIIAYYWKQHWRDIAGLVDRSTEFIPLKNSL